jgi:hypothetical protein
MESRSKRYHLVFLVILVVWQLVLGWRLLETDRWSGFINGDMQSMLALRYWARDGAIVPHAMLFAAQGYTPFIKIFDGTALDDHASSSSYIKDGQMVRRIYYNHYPSFFLVPNAIVLWLIGTEHPALFRMVQLAISAAGLFFLYLFLWRLFRSRVAAGVATAAYMLSELYTDFAHSLVNMASDDFFRNGFLLLTVIEKTAESARRRLVTTAMWLSYFLVSLVSLESLVFCFVWLVGYDLFHERRWRGRRWSLFALAPILARVIQYAQSVIAFGWTDARLDWFGRFTTMANQDGRTTILERFLSISRELRYLVGFGYDKHQIILLHLVAFFVTLALVAGLFVLARRERERVGSWLRVTALIPVILLAAGCGFGFIFPGASWMRYEGRQFIPFFTALVAYAIINWKNLVTRREKILVAILLIAPSVFITARQIQLTVVSFMGSPQYSFGKPEPEQLKLGRAIAPHIDNRTSMVFMYDPDKKLILFYPYPLDPTVTVYAASPQLLYTADAHVMGFNDEAALTRDLAEIEKQTGGKVRPYIVTDSTDRFGEITRQLKSIGFVPKDGTPTDLEGNGQWFGAEFMRNP